jgi:hypothetical protein
MTMEPTNEVSGKGIPKKGGSGRMDWIVLGWRRIRKKEGCRNDDRTDKEWKNNAE